jgi:hypothetical protein
MKGGKCHVDEVIIEPEILIREEIERERERERERGIPSLSQPSFF